MAVPGSTKSTPVTFRRVGLNDIDPSAWSSLLFESGSRNLHYDRSFIDAARKAWPTRQPTGIIVGYREECLVFLQPYRMTKGLFGTTVRLADIPTADHIEPVIAAEDRVNIISDFRRYLIESLEPDRVVGHSLTSEFALKFSGGFRSSAVKPGKSRRGWILELPNSMDAFWKRYRANFRSQLRRKLKKGISAGLTFRTVTHASLPAGYNLQSAMDNLVRLHELRFDSLNRKSFFLRPEFRTFHEGLCQRATNHSLTVSFTEAIHEGRVIASIYGVRTPQLYLFLMSGFDPRFSSLSPGSLLLYHTIKDLIGRGVRIFDFKCGDETYKKRWASGYYDNLDLEIVLTRRGRMLHHGRSTANCIRLLLSKLMKGSSITANLALNLSCMWKQQPPTFCISQTQVKPPSMITRVPDLE